MPDAAPLPRHADPLANAPIRDDPRVRRIGGAPAAPELVERASSRALRDDAAWLVRAA